MQALSKKHAEDIFIPECKDGPTHTNGHRRLDAWVMEKKWSRPRVIGYEVKVSRSDFLADNKWQAYLPLCNELIFVAPKGIIQESELGAEAGFVELVGESRLVTRKKAAYRDVKIPEELYRYVLMNRVQITREKRDTASYWREWLAANKEDKRLGYEVSRAIREHVERVESENRRVDGLIKTYDDVRAFMQRVGYNPDRAVIWDLEEKYKRAISIMPDGLIDQLDRLKKDLTGVLAEMQKHKPTIP